jgi:hypothetical protein
MAAEQEETSIVFSGEVGAQCVTPPASDGKTVA